MQAKTADELTEDQRDGRACMICGKDGGSMEPVGILGDSQIFAHPGCSILAKIDEGLSKGRSGGRWDDLHDLPEPLTRREAEG